jgi:hypothetical protein
MEPENAVFHDDPMIRNLVNLSASSRAEALSIAGGGLGTMQELIIHKLFPELVSG